MGLPGRWTDRELSIVALSGMPRRMGQPGIMHRGSWARGADWVDRQEVRHRGPAWGIPLSPQDLGGSNTVEEIVDLVRHLDPVHVAAMEPDPGWTLPKCPLLAAVSWHKPSLLEM